ncbi:MAG: DUF5659 domain-containing protein [Candidatus Daviesbacteria bacterium]|nr:DUF5659 domain-containing protein [Candidatus Daviesbacteria bacterium]
MKSNTFELTDFEVATILIIEGFNLLEVDKSNPHKASFIFENNPRIAEVINSYFNDKLSVNPRMLFMESKTLKNRLYL